MSEQKNALYFLRTSSNYQIISIASIIGAFNLHFAFFRATLPPPTRYFFGAPDFLHMNFNLLLSATISGFMTAFIYYAALYLITTTTIIPRLIFQIYSVRLKKRTLSIRKIAIFTHRFRKLYKAFSTPIKACILFITFSLFHFENSRFSFISMLIGLALCYMSFFSFYIFSFRVNPSALSSILSILRKPAGVDESRWWGFLFQALAFLVLTYSASLGALTSRDRLNERLLVETMVETKIVGAVYFSSNGVLVREDSELSEKSHNTIWTFIPTNSILSLKPISSSEKDGTSTEQTN